MVLPFGTQTPLEIVVTARTDVDDGLRLEAADQFLEVGRYVAAEVVVQIIYF
jgi:hypothetical protein